MPLLILLRHGQSIWNQENRFTGWIDVPLSAKGQQEALLAGRNLKSAGFRPDFCFTSYLKRAVKTLCLVLEEMDLLWLPVHKTWRLNERHYGTLQGLNKQDTVAEYGLEQVQQWRRSFKTIPPALDRNDPANPAQDPRYAALKETPAAESLEMTIQRVLPVWKSSMAPLVAHGHNLLICAHGNSLRGLLMHLKGISETEIVNFELPTGLPLILEMDEQCQMQGSFFLDQA